MTLELLLAEFDGLIQTPADVEKLQLGIIDWAVQGKLDTQNEDDEPASLLLEKLTFAREELEDARRAKKKRQTKPFSKDETPHSLPKTWQWVRLPQIGLINPRNDLNDALEVSFIPMALVPEDYGQEVESEAREWKEIKKGYTHFQENDIAFAKITPCFQNRKSAVLRGLVNGAGAGTTELVVLRTDVRFIVPDYVLLFFKSPRFIETGVSQMKGTAGQQRVPNDYYLNVPFPLPPLAEQKRIVARVDELLGQTAVLAQQLASVHEQRRGVHTAVLHQLTTKTLEVSSERSSPTSEVYTLTTHFDRFYVDADIVAELKQAILQLAVQGRLVPQDERDEDAAVLLAQIQEEKKKLLEQRKFRPEKDFLSIKCEEIPFGLPSGWRWVRLGQLIYFLNGYAFKSNTYVENSTNQVIRLGNVM